MYEKINAIVISTLKYNDSSIIVKCLTKQGTRSYLIKGIFKNTKSPIKIALFLPLTQLELIATHKNNNNLEHIKEAKINIPYYSLHTNIYKSAVTMFLAEVCTQISTSEAPDEELFLFLQESLLFFDRNDFSSHFHLKFLLSLTRYLGFYPDYTHNQLPFFDLEEGTFTTTNNSDNVIAGNALNLFKKIVTSPYSSLTTLKSNKTERNTLLRHLLKYYQWHFPNFKPLKSLEVLETLF